MKIFCIGPPKSGTLTLHRAFTEAGLLSCHGQMGKDQPPIVFPLWRAFIEGRDPLFYIPHGLDAVTDAHLTRSKKYSGQTLWPGFSPPFLQSLRKHHPDLLILLHTRKTEDWVSSVNRWKDLHSRIAKSDLPFLHASNGGTDKELAEWIEDHYQRVRKLFAGDPKFLEIAIEDPEAPKKISQALGIEFPWWGRENANP